MMESITPNAAFVPDETINPAPTEGVTPVKAKKEKKAKEPKPPKVPVVRLEHEKKNGVVKPSPETSTGKIWKICQELGDATGAIPKRADVIEKALLLGLNSGTASTQFGRFCKYWGIKNERVNNFKKKEKAPKEPAVEGQESAPTRGVKSGKKDLTAAAGASALSDVKIETSSEDTAA